MKQSYHEARDSGQARLSNYDLSGRVPAPVKRHEAKILIVEDEELVALDIEGVLTDMGIHVTGRARRVEDAIASIEAEQPHLVLLDISLSGHYEGVELAHTIQRRWQIPVLFISGHLGDEAVQGIEQLTVAGYLVKPFHNSNLQDAVDRAIATLHHF